MTRTLALSLGLVALGVVACVHGGNRDADRDSSTGVPDSSIPGEDAPSLQGDDAFVGMDGNAPSVDRDGDGVPAPADCDDDNPLVFPGAVEDCTTPVDEDCDGDADILDLDCDVDEDVDEDTDEDVDEDSDEG